MKKLLVLYVAFAMTLLVGINVVKMYEYYTTSEEEIMEQYINENYGEEYHGVLLDYASAGCISFRVYDEEENLDYSVLNLHKLRYLCE